MRCQKCDHIPGTTVGKIRVNDLLQFLLTDSSDRKQFSRLLIQDFQCFLTECIVNLFCSLLTDSSDLPGSKISNDTLLGGSDHFLIPLHFILQTMLGILGPSAFHAVLDLIGRGKAIADRLKLVQDPSCRIPDRAAGLVHRDHESVDGCCSISGKNDSFKLTKHLITPL